MISLTSHDFFSCFSSIFLGLSACFFLAFFSFFFDKSIYIKENSNRYYFIIKAYCFYITLFILLFALLLECNNPIDSFVSFWGFFSYNFFTHSVTLIILLLSTFVLLGSFAYITKVDFFSFEFFFLYLLAVFALACLPLSADFLGVYLLLELQSLIFYSLASFKRTSSFSTEAGVKYFIIGAFASGILLFGMSLVYGATGSLQFETLKMILFDTSYVTFDLNIFLCYFGFFLIFCSFCFKISAAPFHFWSPEVYEGSVSPVSFFFAVVPKISLFGTLLNICTGVFFEFSFFWENLFYSIAILSFAFGSFSALSQKKTKKFLALSSVTHVGFIIAAASAHSFNGMVSLFFYLFVYSFLSLCFWSVVTFTRKEDAGNLGKYIVDLRYFCKQNILIGVSLAILLFSMAGIPPLSGFGAKFFSFLAVLETNSILLSFCIVLFAVVSCFYYLRVIKWLFFDNAQLKKGIVSNQYPAVLLKMSYFESFVFTSGLFFSSFIFIYPDFFILVSHRIALALFL